MYVALAQLILNAGIGVAAYETSGDGIDHHFQINVLSHYIFAQTLLPNLQQTAAQNGDARLVFMSSSLHSQPPPNVKFESLDELNQDVGPLKLYGRTKLADLLLAKDMVRKHSLEGTNLFCNATHPGGVSTGQQTQVSGIRQLGKALLTSVDRWRARTPTTNLYGFILLDFPQKQC